MEWDSSFLQLYTVLTNGRKDAPHIAVIPSKHILILAKKGLRFSKKFITSFKTNSN
jgi:hypothetical protein